MFWPSNQISPLVGSISRNRVRPSVVLPQPLSPTSPTHSPSLMAKLTPSTARTQATGFCKMPARTGKCVLRFLISTRLISDRPLQLRFVPQRTADLPAFVFNGDEPRLGVA